MAGHKSAATTVTSKFVNKLVCWRLYRKPRFPPKNPFARSKKSAPRQEVKMMGIAESTALPTKAPHRVMLRQTEKESLDGRGI